MTVSFLLVHHSAGDILVLLRLSGQEQESPHAARKKPGTAPLRPLDMPKASERFGVMVQTLAASPNVLPAKQHPFTGIPPSREKIDRQ